jgi:hypothetical protein
MIDLLNRIGFRQIAFGGEGGGGGGGGGNNDNDDDAYDPYEDADLYDDNGYQQEYSGPDYGGNDNNDNDNNDRDDRQPTPPPPPPPITYDPYEDASLYDAGGYVQSYSGPDYGGGGGQSDEDTVMSQPVTYTAPDPVTSTLTATSPTDTSNLYDFYDFNDNNDEETVMSQPVTYTGPAFETTLDTGDFSLDDLDLGTGVAPVDETPISVFDAAMLSKITNIRGITPPQTNWVGDNTQEAINLNQNNRFDFDLADAYDTEKSGALPVDGPVPRPRPDNLIMGTSPIGPTVTVSTKDALTTPQTFGALPDGVTQQMITDSQNDGKYGYYNNDGSYVPKEIDKYNGGGPDYSGVRFASGGGAQFDLDGDRFLSKTEMRIGEAAGKELDQNFWSKLEGSWRHPTWLWSRSNGCCQMG